MKRSLLGAVVALGLGLLPASANIYILEFEGYFSYIDPRLETLPFGSFDTFTGSVTVDTSIPHNYQSANGFVRSYPAVTGFTMSIDVPEVPAIYADSGTVITAKNSSNHQWSFSMNSHEIYIEDYDQYDFFPFYTEALYEMQQEFDPVLEDYLEGDYVTMEFGGVGFYFLDTSSTYFDSFPAPNNPPGVGTAGFNLGFHDMNWYYYDSSGSTYELRAQMEMDITGVTITPVPEPALVAPVAGLLALGAVGAMRRRRARA